MHAIVRNVETIVKLSSIVRKSLTYLDLSLCEFSIFEGKRKNTVRLEIYDFNYPSFSIEVSNDSLYTENNWKKILQNDGQLCAAVTCNVDLITEFPEPFKNCTIFIPHYFYEDPLRELLDYAIENIKPRLTVARKILKPLKYINYMNGTHSFIKHLAHIFYSDCTDLNIWQDFLAAFRIEEYILFEEYWCYNPKVIERVLYYACQSGYDLKNNSLNRDLIVHCFPTELHAKVKMLLKFISAPRYCPYTHHQCRTDLYKNR
ncbi:hypothetical protein AVEN_171304-1 [Araneus ventricosus]|uniref:SOCS box domain-containing protein n=1 Tax=Araneus ventricosus TaxID=182803 RepID=A0A4Y2KJF8_ARAVE|nr:hypothetical protein AVEN_171304-1 [Araneus ventricosus]